MNNKELATALKKLMYTMNNKELATALKKFIDEHASVDSDNWALARIAELRAKGEQASAIIKWKHNVFEVIVRRADGSIQSMPEPSYGVKG